MRRPITLFTGQWADLALADLAKRAAHWGFDGLELACWGDHFEVDRALREPDYLSRKRDFSTAMARGDTRCRRILSARPYVTRWTSAIAIRCPRRCGVTAIPKACATGHQNV